MSRSFGGLVETSLPPMWISPWSTSSSPASMRRAVDLPEPDGPTRTMNSPSLMSRSKSLIDGVGLPGYWQYASTYLTSATLLSLHAAGQQAADEEPLECDEHEQRDHDGHERRRG